MDYRKLRDNFEGFINDILIIADENHEDYPKWEKSFLLEVINETLFSFEAKIEAFQQTLAVGQAQESLVVSNVVIWGNSSSRVSIANAPKLEKIPIPRFDGNILNFANVGGGSTTTNGKTISITLSSKNSGFQINIEYEIISAEKIRNRENVNF